ncbi:hypothetical protein GCM10007385_44330 [Tateyamaria omphalii]|uniref:tetratricopeptide repeat protein n=1 Tax=Tateyamaria omphalii TaxID=299262 RepID=UPI0019BB6FA7|nr:tetratricopeptide repeat protein [Tateyamaria omphalii]GGX70449.1 hypothetical protein GCM10007385_44330 [Tateyamaria omphalii]
MARSFAVLAMLLTLVGCAPDLGTGVSSFQKQYATARTALESGRYARAIQAYSRIVEQAGPLTSRIELELAHSYLRDGQYAAASKTARRVANAETGDAKFAALAVQGTADHELGLAALKTGDTAKGRSFLTQADTAMKTVLESNAELDPLGALAGRRASIAVRLKTL